MKTDRKIIYFLSGVHLFHRCFSNTQEKYMKKTKASKFVFVGETVSRSHFLVF